MRRNNVFFDALSIAAHRKSGIGHITLETIRALSMDDEFIKKHRLVLVVPLFKKKAVARYGLEADIKTVLLPARIFNLLLKLNLLPPLDIFLGQGTYIFTNYRNWPVLLSRSITYIHDLSYKKFPESLEPKNLKYITKGIPLWLKRTDIVVTASLTTREEIINELNVSADRVKVIYHGVDQDVFQRVEPGEVAQVKKRLGITVKNYVLYVGNLEPRKNLERLIQAYSELSVKTRKEHPLLLVGAMGWGDNSTVNAALASGAVIKVDRYVEDGDLPALYSGSHFLVQPALYEGFGVSPLQALACGTSVLLSDIPVFKEIFGRERKGVSYVDPYRVSDIRESLLAMMKKPGRVQTDNLYSWSEAAHLLNGLVSDLEDSKV